MEYTSNLPILAMLGAFLYVVIAINIRRLSQIHFYADVNFKLRENDTLSNVNTCSNPLKLLLSVLTLGFLVKNRVTTKDLSEWDVVYLFGIALKIQKVKQEDLEGLWTDTNLKSEAASYYDNTPSNFG